MKTSSATLELDRIHEAYRTALAEGRLILQRCACGQCWAPARADCPACLGARSKRALGLASEDWTWETAQGGGRIKSWVIYHVAFHDAFRDRVPYNVALVELDEGPQLITNIVADNALLSAEARVRFVAEREGERTLARFELVR